MGAASRPPAPGALSRHRANPPARDAGPRGRAGQSESKSNSDDEQVANAGHVADAHADLIGKLSRDDSLVSASNA
jgi:hypothetical protein